MTTLVNPFTEILKEAEKEIRVLEAAIISEYGIPLYAEIETGAKALEFPDKSPDDLMPEEMQVLIQLHGEDAVNSWIEQALITRMQQDLVDEEKDAE